MAFFVSAADLISKSSSQSVCVPWGEKIEEVKTRRRMARLVDDAVDRIVEQTAKNS